MIDKKVVLVTGASRGIGKEIAIHFAKQGAMVILNYNGSKNRAEETKKEIEAFNGSAVLMQCNVRKEEEVKGLMDGIINQFGRIDVVVNNAGITKDNLMLRMTKSEMEDVLDINLMGSFFVMRQALRPMMKQRGGRIINVSSVVGITGNAGQANYAASKAGVIGMTKSLAKEVGSRNITVNAVAPGFIDTEMTANLNEEWKKTILNQIPLNRMGSANDVANVVTFLASEEAAYITGQVIRVDGGLAF